MVGHWYLYRVSTIKNIGDLSMTKLPITITFLLVGSLLIGTCSLPTRASSSILFDSSNLEASEYSISIPVVLNRYPLIPIFGVEARSADIKISEANLHWVRLNGIRWSDVQPAEFGAFDWSTQAEIESNLITASQRGLQTILVIRSTPAWAQKNQDQLCGPIREDHLPSFANFMREVVQRYSRPPYNVQYFQIWNEPDAPFIDSDRRWGCWGEPTGDYFGGEYFAEMLKTIYPAMKSANPNIKVVLGGLLLDCDPTGVGDGYCLTEAAAQQWNFFEGILKNNGGSAFDIAAFHGYGFYSSQEKPVSSERNHSKWSANGGAVDGKLKYLRGLMSQYGVDKPIIQTEAAIVFHDSQNAPADEQYQAAKADYVVWAMARNYAEGLLGTTWYSWRGWRGSGLVNQNQEPFAAYYSLKNMATKLKRAVFVSRDVLDGYDRFIYRKENQNIWLLIPISLDLTIWLDIHR
jgi:hypothetical protein